jgi:hypothetical protein
VALFVPHHHQPPSGNGRSGVERREVDLGGRITLGWLSYHGTVPLDASRLTEFHLLELPLHGSVRLDRGGQLAARHRAVHVDAAGPLAQQVPAACAVLTVRIDLSLVEQHFATLTGRPPPTPIRFATGPHAVRTPTRRWLTKIGALVGSLERDPGLVDEPWFRAEVEGWWIVAGLLHVQPHNHSRLLPRPSDAAGSPLTMATAATPWAGTSIGPLLARRRHHLGLSQSRLAQLLADVSGTPSITRERVSDYERERHIPDDWLEYLSIVLDLPLEELERAAQLARARRYKK